MKICAVILNYRDAQRTEACLSSLSGQGLSAVMVVDNSADDRFADELAGMMERQKKHVDYALRLLAPDSNLGFARGVNFALRNTNGLCCDAFLLVNNDAIAMPGMVSQLASALADGDTSMVAPTVLDSSGKPLPVLWYQRFFGVLTTHKLPGSFSYLSGCCLLVRSETPMGAGLLDEDFFMYGEDTLLGWHLARAGKIPLRLTSAYVRHAGCGSSQRGRLFYEYHMARAHILLAMKTWRHPAEIPFLLICKCAGLCARALWRSLRFGSFVPLRAFFMAWRAEDIRVP